MPKYVLLAQAADAASANILVKGADGLRAQQEALASLGGRMEAQFVVTGDYGIVLIEDLPTGSSVLALSRAGNTGGLMSMSGEPMVRLNPTLQLAGTSSRTSGTT
jgi:uncharacterized protein with GYD domain